jgi:cell wall-associated NlpC family hydrolase
MIDARGMRIRALLFVAVAAVSGCVAGPKVDWPEPAMPHIAAVMFHPDFWINRLSSPYDVLMSEDEIARYNESVVKADLGVVDPLRFPSEIAGDEIRSMIAGNVTGRVQIGKAFVGGDPVTADFVAGLEESLNLAAIPERKAVIYAIATRRTMLRTFPTDTRVHYTAGDREFDRLVESAVSIGKPMLVLHESKDKLWRYVRVPEFDGWVKTDDIGMTADRVLWSSYLTAHRRLVVLAADLILATNPYTPEFSAQQLTMGSSFPLVEGKERPRFIDRMETSGQHVVSLPLRRSDGTLAFREALVPFSADVRVGFLPFTRANLIRQAFKIQGQRYGWGGDFGTRDCSLFVGDVYRSMGFVFPRNSRLELSMPGREVRFDEVDSAAKRTAALAAMPTGTLLGWNGHIMMLLGEYNGHHYVIHDGSAFGDSAHRASDGNLEELPLNQVSVTSLSMLRATGKSYRDTLTIMKSVR